MQILLSGTGCNSDLKIGAMQRGVMAPLEICIRQMQIYRISSIPMRICHSILTQPKSEDSDVLWFAENAQIWAALEFELHRKTVSVVAAHLGFMDFVVLGCEI